MAMADSAGFSLHVKEVEPGTYEIEIRGEDDTIGHLLSTYLELYEDIQLSYYTRPHPLEDRIIVYVKLKNPSADFKKIISNVINIIIKDTNELREAYTRALSKVGANLED